MKVNNWQKFSSVFVKGWLLVFLVSTPMLALAGTLTLAVANGEGGAITLDTGGERCRLQCGNTFKANSGFSLLAEPDKGYRFRRWSGVCAGTIGPLCTLRLTKSGQAGAQFVKTPVSGPPAKALLLLHGADEKPAIWNKFAERYFNQQCPEIYGGVVLDSGHANPRNGVYCYRIAFGYYRSENNRLTTRAPAWNLASRQKLLGQQVNEISAAVLGIKQRHPEISLALVSAVSVNEAALTFLEKSSSKQHGILALLTLQSSAKQPQANHAQTSNSDLPVTNLFASPRQVAKINAALVQATGSWWLSK